MSSNVNEGRCRHLFKNGERHCTNPAVPGGDRCLFHQAEPLDWSQPYAQKLILTAAKNGTLEEAHLAGAQLKNCDLSGCNLKGADFRDADLTAADLSGSDCRNASFAGACLLGANLDKADCARANFDQADCQVASLNGTVLRKISCYKTDYRSTNLSRAVIAADALAEAITDEKTVWPEVIPDGTGSNKETDAWTIDRSVAEPARHHENPTSHYESRFARPTTEGSANEKFETIKNVPRTRRGVHPFIAGMLASLMLLTGIGVGAGTVWHLKPALLEFVGLQRDNVPVPTEPKDPYASPQLAERLTKLSAERDALQQQLAQQRNELKQKQRDIDALKSQNQEEKLLLRQQVSQLNQAKDQALLAQLTIQQQGKEIDFLQKSVADHRRMANILTEGVDSLESRNRKLEEQLRTTLGRETLLANSERERKKLLTELTETIQERDTLARKAQTYERQLLETNTMVGNLLSNIEGTRLQGLLAGQNTGQTVQLIPGQSVTLVSNNHALSFMSDKMSTKSGKITLQGRQEDGLPRIMCVFSDEHGRPLRKVTYDFADHRLDQGFVTMQYDTGLSVAPSYVRISLIDPVIDRFLENIRTPTERSDQL